jgi:hypothetical protein
MTKIKEFYLLIKKTERSDTKILGTLVILAHFRHYLTVF